jgi:hypothetical protein
MFTTERPRQEPSTGDGERSASLQEETDPTELVAQSLSQSFAAEPTCEQKLNTGGHPHGGKRDRRAFEQPSVAPPTAPSTGAGRPSVFRTAKRAMKISGARRENPCTHSRTSWVVTAVARLACPTIATAATNATRPASRTNGLYDVCPPSLRRSCLREHGFVVQPAGVPMHSTQSGKTSSEITSGEHAGNVTDGQSKRWRECRRNVPSAAFGRSRA